MNKELLEVMEVLEKEKNISKDTLTEAIENSLLTTCKNHSGKADNVKVTVNPSTCDSAVYMEKTVVENVEDDCLEMSLVDAKMSNPRYEIRDTVQIPLDSKKFDYVATQNAKSMVLQKICEEERKALYNEYYTKEKDVITSVAQRYLGRNVSINLGRVDAILNESEQVKSETFRPTERVKVYVIEVKDTPKGPRVPVFRTHPDPAKRLFELGVAEVRDGTVETKAIAREAGPRTKIAVKSNDANMDPVGACVGLNGFRVNSIVSELKGEKINITNWDDNPAYLIENVLSLTKAICVVADEEERGAQATVPNYQLSPAIGKGGQSVRLAARLTSLKIDIKSETQAREMGLFEQMGLQYGDTPSEAYEEETEETESYRKYEENYQEDGSEQ